MFRESRDWMPVRPVDEEPDDPDRVVSFDDIRPFLRAFEQSAINFKIFVNFIHYLGVDIQQVILDFYYFKTRKASRERYLSEFSFWLLRNGHLVAY